jgi:hypothetical protein
MYKTQDKITLTKLRKQLKELADLIFANKNLMVKMTGEIVSPDEMTRGTNMVQFQIVSDAIDAISSAGTKPERDLRDTKRTKAKAGLARILSKTIELLEKMQKLEVVAPEKFKVSKTDVDISTLPSRITPQRAPLSRHDIVDFIRQYGPEYGILSLEDWTLIFDSNPHMKEEMTTVINALNRGEYPVNAHEMKSYINSILSNYRSLHQTNVPTLEAPEGGADTSTFEESEGPSYHKIKSPEELRQEQKAKEDAAHKQVEEAVQTLRGLKENK